MKTEQKISDGIKKQFSTDKLIKRNELYSFIKETYLPDLIEITFRWYVHKLKKSGLLVPVKRGVYRIGGSGKIYVPFIEKKHQKLYKDIVAAFSDIVFCIWSTNWFNDFSIHLAMKNIIIIETEKDLVFPVFYLLKDKGYSDIFVNPDKKVVENYIFECNEAVAVKPIVTKSPLQNVNNVAVPKLEKMLVDLIAEKNLTLPFQGNEAITIFKNAFDKNQINISTLLNYAKRRTAVSEIKEILEHELKIDKELLK